MMASPFRHHLAWHRSVRLSVLCCLKHFGHSNNMSKECDPFPSKFSVRRTCKVVALTKTQLFLLLALTQRPSLPSDRLENGLLISLVLFPFDSMGKIFAPCLPSHSLPPFLSQSYLLQVQ